MSILVGFKCDGSIPDATEPCGGSDPCTSKIVAIEQGSSSVGATDKAKDLEQRLAQQGWRFLGGYCYCPDHK